MVVWVMVFPMIADGLTPSLGKPTAWLVSVGVISVFCLIITFLMIPGIREDKALRQARVKLDEEQVNENFFKILFKSLKEKNLVGYLFSNLFYSASTSLAIIALDYWVIYGLGMELSDSILPLMAFLFAGPLAAPVWMRLSKKIGSKKVYLIGMFAFGLTFLGFLLVNNFRIL